MNSEYLRPSWTRRSWIGLMGVFAASAASAGFGESTPKATQNTPQNDGTEPPSKPAPINVAVVLGAYNTLIDFAGPWEVLSSSGRFNVYSVAASRSPVLCDDARSLDKRRPISGLTVVPDFTFEDAPEPRIILVGGQDEGRAQANQARKIEWLRRAFKQAALTARAGGSIRRQRAHHDRNWTDCRH